ncbi:hypothetical protein Q5752_002751 [Cryptotrichosporon argae]
MPIPFYHPKPAEPGAFAGQPLPQRAANPLSRTFFLWVAPIMRVGYTRPLQPDDLWDLTDDLQCQTNADALEQQFLKRLPPSRRPGYLAKAPTTFVPIGQAALHAAATTGPGAAAEEAAVAEAMDDVAAGLGRDGDNTQAPIPLRPLEVHPSPSSASTIHEPLDEKKVNDQSKANTASDHAAPVDPTKPVAPGSSAPPKVSKKVAAKIAKGEIAYEDGKKYDMSLIKAMFHTFRYRWLFACACYTVGSILQITAPLVTKLIVNQMDYGYAWAAAEAAGESTAGLTQPKSIGYGIGLAVALFVMEYASSIFIFQSQQRGSVIGFLARASLIDLISRKSMRLSGKSRLELTNGRLTTMVSADCSFLDFAGPFTIELFIQPIQVLVGIALLLYTLGYSALVGLAVLILFTPTQGLLFVRMITYRQAQMKIVDTRVRMLSEIINNIRAVKLYAYENFFGEKVSKLRAQELAKLRRNGLNRSTMTASSSFVPILAAVLTFITYSLSGHDLNVATIFSGLQYFNTLKQPITMLPVIFTAVSDAAVAVGRIGVALRAEELKSDIKIDVTSKYGINVVGDFAFDSSKPPDSGKRGHGMKDRAAIKEMKKKEKAEKKARKAGAPAPPPAKPTDDGVPFSLRGIELKVPRGSLVCVVGRVGTGKTALLSGMINEMKQTRGSVTFGGPVSYVPQHAWVQSGSIRENITFYDDAEKVDEAWINEVIDACALRPDIDMMADGEETKIGEKGITLSGGQRQRICLARAAYSQASEVVLLDDPLSAVDAHVGHHLLQNLILNGPFAHKTRVLVTHHLDVLPKADLVIVLDRVGPDHSEIIQQGTYAELREQEGVFRTLMEEYGSTATEKPEDEAEAEAEAKPTAVSGTAKKAPGGGAKLLLDEEREVGAVPWSVYLGYARSMGSPLWVLACALFLCATQAATVANTLFLGFWSGSEISGMSTGGYMGIYAALGVAVAIFTWLAAYIMILAGIRASFTLFDGAWAHVLRSPVSWHDRTPTGRIISRLSKDIEMLDDRLSQFVNQLLTNALSVVGTFVLVIYSFAWLGLAFIPLGILFYFSATYYRATSREVKRIDSILRSNIYNSFGEQLAGLAVIRAFGRQKDFEKRLQDSVNGEGRAYIITITIQRWLGVRLDLLSYTLVMLLAMFGAIFRASVNPSKLGVVLTYSLSAASVFAQLIQFYAMVEQEMNNVERVQFYNDLPVEAAPVLPTDPPVEQWPTKGAVTFENVQLKYRPELPLVLKGLTFSIKAGEKIGIIGRTGAGKSSIAQALFRTVELSGGKITVDDLDLRGVGLETLRTRLAIIPQDAFLYGGTVRDNLDPLGARTDAELHDAVNLIRTNAAGGAGAIDAKFTLDAPVLNEGANFSAGERQLLSLIRALVRRCKVLLLDEATSSVDPQTDAVIQRIIQTEFADVTLISIAHRLQTVAYYDRILVLDAGEAAEYDSPLALFDTPGSAFKALCDTKGLSRDDILKIQQDAGSAAQPTAE